MLFDLIREGGPVMYPLIFCSVLALTIVAERFFFWMKVRREGDPQGIRSLLDLVEKGQIQESLQVGRGSSSPVARVLVCGLERVPGGDRGSVSPGRSRWSSSVSRTIEMQAQVELRNMRRYLGILETLITVAPLLGIYGTITGIIQAFGFLAGTGIPDPQRVATGISEALITTVAGLTIAILSIPPYNFFSAKTEEMAHDMERQATHLELLLQGSVSEEPVGSVKG